MKLKKAKRGFWLEHDAELRQYAEEDGLTVKQTAEKMGVSPGAVKGRAYRIGVKWANLPLFWEMKQKKKFIKVSGDREDARVFFPDPMEYWIKRSGWGFPPSGHCVFPYGDPQNVDFAFCGEPVIQAGKSYCPEHHSMAYYRTTRGV